MFKTKGHMAIKVEDYKKFVDTCKKLKIKSYKLEDDYFEDKAGKAIAWILTVKCSKAKYKTLRKALGLTETMIME